MIQNPYHESSSERLASILNNVPASIIVCSAESRTLLYANERARKLFLKEDYRPGITCYEAAGHWKPCDRGSDEYGAVSEPFGGIGPDAVQSSLRPLHLSVSG